MLQICCFASMEVPYLEILEFLYEYGNADVFIPYQQENGCFSCQQKDVGFGVSGVL